MENATNRVLDALAAKDKAAGGTGTDYKVAQLLGVEPQYVGKYRRGTIQMTDLIAIKAAELLGVEPLRLIGEIAMEKARDDREKKFWQRTVKNNGGKVAGLVLAVMMTASGFAGSERASAAAFSVSPQLVDLYNAHNARRRRRPWWRWLLAHPFPELDQLGALT